MQNSKSILLLTLFAFWFQLPGAHAQSDTLYYINDDKQGVEEAAATYKMERKKTAQNQWAVTCLQKKDSKWEFFYRSEIHQTNDSSFVETKHLSPNNSGYKINYILHQVPGGYLIQENGKTISKGLSLTFFPLRKHGKWTDFDSLSGRKVEEMEFENGRDIGRNTCFFENGEILENVFRFVDIDPIFRYQEMDLGKFIGQNLVYPKDAINANAQGRVYVTFIILSDGTLKDLRLLKGYFKSCDEESLRVVAATSGKWIPGVKNGTNVHVRVTLPIIFRLTRTGK